MKLKVRMVHTVGNEIESGAAFERFKLELNGPFEQIEKQYLTKVLEDWRKFVLSRPAGGVSTK